MSQIQSLYLEFLANFPASVRPLVSLGLAIFLVYSIFKVVKKDFVFIIALIVLLPASIPILQNVWQGIVTTLKFLLALH